MTEERILHLNLKKKWFDMIASGEKKQEYRVNSYYWRNRINNQQTVTFSNGYSRLRRQMVVELIEHYIGEGVVKWGAKPVERYIILRLGKLISKNF